MKTFRRIFLAITLLALWQCEKSRIYNGNQQIKGVVLYQNELTSKLDTAKQSNITLLKKYKQKERGAFSKEEVLEEYYLSSANGTYTLNYLSFIDLSLHAEYKQYISSTKSAITYTLAEKLDKISGTHNPLLKWDNTGRHLKIVVTDSLDNPLENAQICLYRNLNFMEANGENCSGSIYSATTNKYGIAVFANVEESEYYFVASLKIGNISLSNKSETATRATGTISDNSINEVSVKLFQKEQ